MAWDRIKPYRQGRDDINDVFQSIPNRYQIASYRNSISPREALEAKMGRRA
jgi:hypothetical protein